MTKTNRTLHTLARITLGAGALALLSAPSAAQTITWCITATGGEEVPPNNSNAVAKGTLTLDTATNFVFWNVTHTGLTGTHQATHFHKGAIGQNGGVQVGLGTGNPMVGSAPITAGQAADLQNGLWYLNLHSSSFPGGEIRGQVDDLCAVTPYCGDSQNPNNAADLSINTADAATPVISLGLTNGPPNQFVYLLVGNGSNTVSQPPGAKGDLCIVGGNCLGRYDKDIGQINSAGNFSVDIKSANSNPCAGGVNIVPGATWNFQMWHRQPMGQPATFSSALAVTFQ